MIQTHIAASPGLRERKKRAMRHEIQSAALQLFAEQGYDQTSVAQVAEAVGISPMTFYRYFPTKESVVLDDDYDPMIAEVVASQPRTLPPVERVRQAMASLLPAVYEAEQDAIRARVALISSTPALRSSFFDQFTTLEALLAEALARSPRRREPAAPTLATRVVAAACASTMTTAVLYWAEQGFTEAFPDVLDQAFSSLIEEVGR